MADDPLSVTFAALADPTRRAILARLATGEATVNELAEPFAISLQAISKHLKVLERAGLISRGRNAQYRPCRLEAAPLDTAVDWIEQNRQIWKERSTSSSNTFEPSNEPRPKRPRPKNQTRRTRDERRRHQPWRAHLHLRCRRPASWCSAA